MEIILIKGKQASGKTVLAKSLSNNMETIQLSGYEFEKEYRREFDRKELVECIIIDESNTFTKIKKQRLIKFLNSFPIKRKIGFDVNPKTVIINTLDENFNLHIATQTIITKRSL